MYHILGVRSFASTKAEKIVLGGIALTLFAGYTVPSVRFLLPLTVIPILFGLIHLGLRKNKSAETKGNAFTLVDARIPFFRSLILLLAPCIAALIFNSGLYMNTNIFFLFILAPIGSLMFVVSLYKVMRR